MSMYPRNNYEMTEEDLKTLKESMQPVPCMVIGRYAPASQQENANRAWMRLGEKMGFIWDTVQPNGRGERYFSAVPSETEEQKAERLERDRVQRRELEIESLKHGIELRTRRLAELEAKP